MFLNHTRMFQKDKRKNWKGRRKPTGHDHLPQNQDADMQEFITQMWLDLENENDIEAAHALKDFRKSFRLKPVFHATSNYDSDDDAPTTSNQLPFTCPYCYTDYLEWSKHQPHCKPKNANEDFLEHINSFTRNPDPPAPVPPLPNFLDFVDGFCVCGKPIAVATYLSNGKCSRCNQYNTEGIVYTKGDIEEANRRNIEAAKRRKLDGTANHNTA